MRRAIDSYEEDRLNDSADSDRYCLDNLDLLNLRVSFSSDTNTKIESIGNQKRRSKSTEISNKEDGRQTHRPRRCQHFRERKKDSAPLGDHRSGSPNLLRLKKQSFVGGDCSKNEQDDKSVLLLYANPTQEVSKFVPQTLKSRKPRKNRPSKVCTVNIHSMSQKSNHSRNRSPTEQEESGQIRTFPFKITPSGNFKVNSQQVAFESQNLSVLVADPERIRVDYHPYPGEAPTSNTMYNPEQEYPRDSAMGSILEKGTFGASIGSLIAGKPPGRPEKESSEYEGKLTENILDPELNLNRLGFTSGDSIDWNEIKLPEKTNLYLELFQRITNYTNTDCKIYVNGEEFNCHFLVLQSYSELFDEHEPYIKRLEIPTGNITPAAFAFAYEWMIGGHPGYVDLTRENVLEVFHAAKYLRIKDLMEQCWAFIDNKDIFIEDTAFLLYMDARHKKLDNVIELMIPRIQSFFLMLVASQDWLELEKQDVINFLSSNYIRVNCEMEVFMAAVRWLHHDWETRQDDMLDVMRCIRFGLLAPWQLVDIKRNADNPEFLVLSSVPEVCKMIDDGLAVVIITYWYGQENDDFEHWSRILGLQQPTPRNWSGMNKNYVTYREFLIYLDQYRRSQMMEKSKPKERKRRPSADVKTTPQSSIDKALPHQTNYPPMDEFLSIKRKQTDRMSIMGRFRSKDEAATVIQAAYRGYSVRQRLKHFIPSTKVKSPREKQHLAEYKTPIQQWNTQTNIKVLSMFANNRPFISGRPNEISASVLAPVQKDYLTETSLFIADRESVLVFGGIDPHNNYGVGRNTGKDVFRYLPDGNVWEYVGDLPEPRHHHSVAFLRGRVYLCGGADPRDDDIRGKSVVVDTVWSFEPVKRCWFSEGSLSTPRKNFGLVAGNFSMYAIGGQDRQGKTLASVERFNPESGSWEYKAPLNNPRMGVACTKHRDYIWAAGGMSGSKKNPLSDSVEYYDMKNDQWTEITRLRFPRCFGRMFSMSDKLYLIGGAGKVSEKERTTTSVSAIDVWDNSIMNWKHQTDMAIPRHGHAIAYLGTQILIIGGVTTVYMRALSNTECYCTERSTWVRGIACLPTTLSGHAAITLPPASLM